MEKKVYKIGIAIDSPKAKLFKKRLKESGYRFIFFQNGPTRGTSFFQVFTTEPLQLQKLIESTNAEYYSKQSTKH